MFALVHVHASVGSAVLVELRQQGAHENAVLAEVGEDHPKPGAQLQLVAPITARRVDEYPTVPTAGHAIQAVFATLLE